MITTAAHTGQLADERIADRAQGYFATHLGNDVSPALIDDELRRGLSAF